MLESIFSTTLANNLSVLTFLFLLGVALILGFAISLLYVKTHEKEEYAATFPTTLIMLPVITAVIVLLVGTNLASAVSIGGTFALIRFRSAPGDPKDIAYTFLSVAIGVCVGVGFWAYGILFTLIMCAVLYSITRNSWGVPKTHQMHLKIEIPEAMNYAGLFDDIMSKYTVSSSLKTIKTANFGSLCELHYIITPAAGFDSKAFLDALRSRNGNLNISLNLAPTVSFSS